MEGAPFVLRITLLGLPRHAHSRMNLARRQVASSATAIPRRQLLGRARAACARTAAWSCVLSRRGALVAGRRHSGYHIMPRRSQPPPSPPDEEESVWGDLFGFV